MTDPSPRMQTKPIPSSGEPLGVIGLGTYVGFDVRPGSGVSPRLQEVLRRLWEAGRFGHRQFADVRQRRGGDR